MNDFGNQNCDDRARQVDAYEQSREPSTHRRPYRPAPTADLIDASHLGGKVRWILCDAETGYPIAQLKPEPVAVPWGPDKQVMAVQVMRSPASAAVGFLEQAGVYIARCCDGPDLCDECAKLSHDHCDDDPCDECRRKADGAAYDRAEDGPRPQGAE